MRVKRDAGLTGSINDAKRRLAPSINSELCDVGPPVMAGGVKGLTLFADACVVNGANDQRLFSDDGRYDPLSVGSGNARPAIAHDGGHGTADLGGMRYRIGNV